MHVKYMSGRNYIHIYIFKCVPNVTTVFTILIKLVIAKNLCVEGYLFYLLCNRNTLHQCFSMNSNIQQIHIDSTSCNNRKTSDDTIPMISPYHVLVQLSDWSIHITCQCTFLTGHLFMVGLLLRCSF